ncbi:mannitol dehydrogenase family protein [Salipiger sp. PrR002]|uniref:mannitol dehydrogenase family protein n=1 Tax=Salipiger sp. PrR002 TaxID=2706489 RepID=UPI0013B89539|nr:mannitol dehydrogenase family protein [Salipiger sp. PrR002]NDW00928.1 mannitol dehydrogenase family protein [Salipiger sp. PrR002]NDW56475.1 mannitol dehydrogenase family protein [Salipiger sp. PrR004]
MRLTSLTQVPEALRPGYDPQAHGVGIVHLGLGAFHKAHQAALTDLAMTAEGGDWRILGVSLRSPKASDELHPQNGLYTLIVKGAEGTSAQVIGSVADAICSAGHPEPALAAMAAEGTKIVSLTVTEKAYGLDRAAQGCDVAHPAVAADLASPQAPQGVLGLLTEALRRRRDAGFAPFTVLCCDNLPENGVLLRGAVVDFARRIDPDLSEWIALNVAFPSTMVDRITPAATVSTLAEAAEFTGCEDLAAIETESFCQWVIEDNFPQGRPAWEAAGAIFTDDVAAFEAMKLRMLNGSHSMLAYAGFHAGCTYVRDVMANPPLAKLVRRHLATAAATLPPIPGIDTAAYADALASRFENPAIAHETFQIAMDGSEKMPQRIFSAVADARAKGVDCRAFTFATAAWLRHVSGATHDCDAYELRDPRASELQAMAAGKDAEEIVEALRGAAFVPPAVSADDAYWAEVTGLLAEMLFEPMQDVIAREAAV